MGKNITYSSQLQKQATHIFYNTPHISTCSGSCEGGPEHLFFFAFKLWPMLFPLAFWRSRVPRQCILLPLLLGVQLKKNSYCLLFFSLFCFNFTSLSLSHSHSLCLTLFHASQCSRLVAPKWLSIFSLKQNSRVSI